MGRVKSLNYTPDAIPEPHETRKGESNHTSTME